MHMRCPQSQFFFSNWLRYLTDVDQIPESEQLEAPHYACMYALHYFPPVCWLEAVSSAVPGTFLGICIEWVNILVILNPAGYIMLTSSFGFGSRKFEVYSCKDSSEMIGNAPAVSNFIFRVLLHSFEVYSI